MKPIYHHYEKWEDYQNGMYEKINTDHEKSYVDKAVLIMKDDILFGGFMKRVVNEWKFSSEHNLSDSSSNRRAWMGQSALCYAFSCPEYITRLAWWKLTPEEREKANQQADIAIREWELKNLTRSIQIKIFSNYQ
jgi:hypothetical protein